MGWGEREGRKEVGRAQTLSHDPRDTSACLLACSGARRLSHHVHQETEPPGKIDFLLLNKSEVTAPLGGNLSPLAYLVPPSGQLTTSVRTLQPAMQRSPPRSPHKTPLQGRALAKAR